jgi:glutathione S-transferase
MELWHAWACPYCTRVRAALAEKGVPHEGREVDLARKPPELLAINPRGGVPVLVDGGETIVDSLAILEHLDQRWPEPRLFPENPGREAVKQAYERVNALFAPHLPRLARGTPGEQAEARVALRGSMAELDAGIPASGFLVGEFSAADLALASFVAKLPPDWRPSRLGFEGLGRWERAVMDRPSVRAQTSPRAAG